MAAPAQKTHAHAHAHTHTETPADRECACCGVATALAARFRACVAAGSPPRGAARAAPTLHLRPGEGERCACALRAICSRAALSFSALGRGGEGRGRASGAWRAGQTSVVSVIRRLAGRGQHPHMQPVARRHAPACRLPMTAPNAARPPYGPPAACASVLPSRPIPIEGQGRAALPSCLPWHTAAKRPQQPARPAPREHPLEAGVRRCEAPTPITDLQLLLRRHERVPLEGLVNLSRHDALETLLGGLFGHGRRRGRALWGGGQVARGASRGEGGCLLGDGWGSMQAFPFDAKPHSASRQGRSAELRMARDKQRASPARAWRARAPRSAHLVGRSLD